MRNLSHMNLSVRFDSSSKSRKDRLVVDLLPIPDSHPKLESLRLSVADEDGDYEGKIHPALYNKAYIDKFVLDVARVPFLTSLTLSTNLEIHLSSDSDKPFLPLRRLELDRCPRLTDKFMADVYVGLSRDGNWERFEEAIVRRCPKIRTDTGFLDCLTREKIRCL